MRTRVLIPIQSTTFFNELFRVAKLLNASSRYEAILVFSSSYGPLGRDIEATLKAGVRSINAVGDEIHGPVAITSTINIPLDPRKEFIKRILRRLHLLGFVDFLLSFKNLDERSFDNFFFDIWYLRKHIRRVKNLIRRFDIGMIVLGADLVHYDTSCYIRAAHDASIPAVIVPCTMSNADEMGIFYFDIPRFQANRFMNRVFGHFFPQWMHTYRGRKLIRLPAQRALAMEFLKLAPAKPWINLSGYADAIAAESDYMVHYYTREGIPREQIVVTGTPGDDILAEVNAHAEERREALYAQLKLPPKNPMMLVSIPPGNLNIVGGGPKADFNDFRSLLNFWIQSLQAIRGWNIVLNLHPSLYVEELRWLENDQIRIADRPIPALVPLCDVFVASISCVIRLAIACEKPVLNYDVYRFRYSDYAEALGVLTIEEQADFRSLLLRLTADADFREKVARDQRSIASRWGNIDGRAGERMLALFDGLVKRYADR